MPPQVNVFRKKCAAKPGLAMKNPSGVLRHDRRIMRLNPVLSILPLQTGRALSKFFLLWLYGLRVSVCFQMENVLWDLFIELHISVMCHPIVA